MATEVIPGPDDSYCSYFGYLDEAGRPLFHITKRKPRQFPIHFGLGTYHITDSSPDVREQGERFLRELGLRGLANVEFKRDARDGRLKLIECNHRLTASTPVLQAAGADLPLLLYNRVTGAPIDGLANYRPGVWLWSPIQDVRALRAYRRQGELSLRQWARSLRGRPHFPVAKWTDPLPTVAFHARMVEQFVRRRWAARR
jgi:predicted ATP-grasp superfamily ATP-dependent carboligase